MRNIIGGRRLSRLCAAGLVVGVAAAGAPATAQTVEQLIVTGRVGLGEGAQTLSQPVSYADLDLTTKAGQDILRVRVQETADQLCKRLGEVDYQAGSAVPSCQDEAVNTAMSEARRLFAQATPRSYAAPAYAAAPTPPPLPAAPAVTSHAAPASVTVETVTNGPVPDTPENRRRYGQPLSNAGQRTAPVGN